MNPSYPSLWSQPQPSTDPLKPVIDPAPPYESRPNSLADLGVADILDRYQHDTELLKHILMAKAEEDKRRAAEEIRLAEEARLQAKYLDLLEGSSQHSRRTSDLIEGFDALGNNEAPQAWFNNGSNLPMMSQHIDKTPPSPSPTTFMPPPSPYTMFDVPFEQLTISSSPEPSKQKANSSQRNSLNVPTISSNSNNNATNNNSNTQTDSLTPPSPPPPPPHAAPRERPCKRTLSRTRSQRKGPPKTSTNKRNKRVSQQQPLSDDEQQQQQPAQQQQQQQQPAQQQQQQQQPAAAPEEPQLDHGKVMEALRAKLQRSAALQPHQQQQQQKQEQDQTPNSMSPTGILLLDLKNPNRKSFPTRKPHVAAVRRPRPFASAHNYCESSVKKEQG
ncbi:hypothetical protein LRAMOSA05137 [Lichtheimia ramosa]|uniref:Uncharacterized protein n=1 Tax=Lichtheimia ramosa TaxID=688394 RepID=A0A077X159_9FUNG|nr:hypothetical protein LRAMOSA05137 [Lichtheimia ramosa]